MDYKVLYRKYRPINFSELMGQDNIKKLLLNSIIDNKLSHAYIFTGPRGTGKTSTAKIFAKTVNCENLIENNPCEKCSFCLSYNDTPDIIEIDAASNNGVDEIREIRENVKILPNHAKYKIYIIDEVHMLSTSAWNAFLKTLEEPPNHVIFILATTEIQKVPITVLSRCQRFDFQRITETVISELLQKITKKEKINITDEAIEEISKIADGGLRDALSILDQLSNINEKITIDTLKTAFGIVTNNEIKNFYTYYLNGQIKEVIDILEKFKSSGVDSALLITKLLEYLVNILMQNKINKVQDSLNLENLLLDLESCFYKSNKYILIKACFLKHMSIEFKTETNIKNIEKDSEIISREIILNTKSTIKTKTTKETPETEIISQEIISNKNQQSKITDELVNIRINNSFVNADIKLKKEFNTIWSNYISFLFEKNEYKLASLIKDTVVEVVSPTNVLLSTESYSNSVLLNTLTEDISINLLSQYNISKKIICLDTDHWQQEKTNFIKNQKTSKYELKKEPEQIIEEEVISSAENLFGNELVEIN